MSNVQQIWTKENIGFAEQQPRHFPSEYLLRALCSPSYFSFGKEIEAGHNVLDIGCFQLNNLMPFADRGADLFGVEVTNDMVAVSEARADELAMPVQVSAGHNRDLPFAEGTFDFLLSINTIHYEDSAEKVLAGLREFARVGKPDCHFLIATAGREHHFHQSADRLVVSRYRLHTDEFRDGQTMAFFDDERHFEATLRQVFGQVEVAVITEAYPRCSLQFYVAKCCMA